MWLLYFYFFLCVHVYFCSLKYFHLCSWVFSYVFMCVHGCSCVFMGVHVCSWVFMGVHGCSWVFMGVHGCSWVFMGVHGCSCVFMCVHGCVFLIFLFFLNIIFWNFLLNKYFLKYISKRKGALQPKLKGKRNRFQREKGPSSPNWKENEIYFKEKEGYPAQSSNLNLFSLQGWSQF